MNLRAQDLRRAFRPLGCGLIALLAGAGCGRDVQWLDMSGSVFTLGGDKPCYIFLRGETTLEDGRTCLATSAPAGRRHERIAVSQPDPATTVETWIVWPDSSHRLTARLTFIAIGTEAPRIRKIEFGRFEHIPPGQ